MLLFETLETVPDLISSSIYGGSNTFGLSSNTVIGFAFVLVMAIVLSYAYIWMARLFTKQFIWATGILNVVWGFATAIYMLSRKYWSGGIVFLLFAIFSLICFISWRKRIPFSVLMLQTTVDVSKKYGHGECLKISLALVRDVYWYGCH